MSKNPPDIHSINQIAKQFSHDPTQFKNVLSALLDENRLTDPRTVNLMEDSGQPGADITFSSPQPPPAPGVTNVQINIPNNFYKTMYSNNGTANDTKNVAPQNNAPENKEGNWFYTEAKHLAESAASYLRPMGF
jgi:hypothetical protein